ncbi:M23 family metallopeptidase [Streptomyces sp. NBC_01803]|uniref:M23 family metallopeptidase n=1 Tax=Streptomyces sp. NBC_01803 TaxID=2975946 RepID=UPI002DD7CF0E|nr:M23 family metallopeptidase [Streptomyces sp. NBC_01803]WSA45856.1 M23 family metallopeptidase [Streptomyces sp. NBC_01803]
MSDRLLSEVSDHSDHSGIGSYAAYDPLDPSYGHDHQATTHYWGTMDQQWTGYGQQGQATEWYGEHPRPAPYGTDGWDAGQPFAADPDPAHAYDGYHEAGYAYQEPVAQAPEPRYQPDPKPEAEPEPETDPEAATGSAPEPEAVPAPVPVPGPRAQRGRRRRASRMRPRRSAFLSVAAPSLAVLGVTAVATAATVSGGPGSAPAPAPVAAPDPGEAETVAANEEFDTQLTSLSAAADDYAERASRTQGRIDLEAQQEAEEQAAAEEAARREAARQKFFLPVEQHGLSAYFGQSGINWMSTHTGIDFPVGYGTPVRAATDGTISTQWHPSYGNMMILTAPDGTETWYAHLSSTAYTSGSVQAGTVIAYSGNSGTSTGPHLHFEVRPYGGSPVDPLPWLRGNGLEPT